MLMRRSMALLAALAVAVAFPAAASATHFDGHDPLDPGGPGLGPPGAADAVDMFLDPGKELVLGLHNPQADGLAALPAVQLDGIDGESIEVTIHLPAVQKP
jgi:hypothetical protein